MDVPMKWAICDNCDGNGVCENPAFSDGFTGSEWAEMVDGDPDWASNYFAGKYDVVCRHCRGTGKVKVPDEAKMSPEEYEDWLIGQREVAESDAIQRAEQRFGA